MRKRPKQKKIATSRASQAQKLGRRLPAAQYFPVAPSARLSGDLRPGRGGFLPPNTFRSRLPFDFPEAYALGGVVSCRPTFFGRVFRQIFRRDSFRSPNTLRPCLPIDFSGAWALGWVTSRHPIFFDRAFRQTFRGLTPWEGWFSAANIFRSRLSSNFPGAYALGGVASRRPIFFDLAFRLIFRRLAPWEGWLPAAQHSPTLPSARFSGGLRPGRGGFLPPNIFWSRLPFDFPEAYALGGVASRHPIFFGRVFRLIFRGLTPWEGWFPAAQHFSVAPFVKFSGGLRLGRGGFLPPNIFRSRLSFDFPEAYALGGGGPAAQHSPTAPSTRLSEGVASGRPTFFGLAFRQIFRRLTPPARLA